MELFGPWICLLVAMPCCCASLIDHNVNIKSVDRTINLHSQITKITNKLVIENSGTNPVRSFLFAVDRSQKDSLSYVSALLREHGRPELHVQEISPPLTQGIENVALFSVELRDPLQPERSVPVEIEVVLTHELVPHPKEILQKEKQLVKYRGNLYLFSPYFVAKQTTIVMLPSRNIETYTKIKPVMQSDSTVTYGPFENKDPFSQEELALHFENNNKFLTVTRIERTIEVSHWGNIAIEETIDLLHTGALLKGLS